ncbi:hypothetical protein [Cellulophaga omnivescoria]|uniref:hypothetical protein n=1 Tax=Cellulophaga omnivescoria TaxID=1888890 RepID=UPI0015C57179|nr:hypothetical protein [Cellulophaga omnivescoria]WBU88391.1 hypothetical protein PBN93_10965 [Cellulophaga omnivescoria]WKB80371.1 hypothetical protein QYR09_11480 [Cellulophaga lytica]
MKRDLKQGEEDIKFMKEEDKKTSNYLFQNNTITIVAFVIVIAALILLSIAVFSTGTEL